jgi:hypothetical protein
VLVISLHQSATVCHEAEVTPIVMATPSAADLGQYFDFGEAAIPDGQEATVLNTAAIQSGEG